MMPRFDYSKIVFSVVWVIGGFLLLNVIGYWIAVLMDIEVPAGLETLLGTALGYMGGILTSTKGTSEPQDTRIVNPPSDPVNTSETDG